MTFPFIYDQIMEIQNLKPNPNNPRTITDEKLKLLEKSLNEFGDLSGFVFNRTTNQLVGGHQRAKIFPPDAKVIITKKNTKPSKVGTLAEGYVDFNGERFSYREVSWDKLKEQAANVAANKGAGEFDPLKLTEWFSDLETFGFDLDLTMFSELERNNYLGKDVDPLEEWAGMPEFDHKDKTAYRSIVVHFKDEDGVKTFAKIAKANITDKTRYLWYPEIEIERMMDKRYSAGPE